MDGNIADQLAAYDNGELDDHDTIALFQDLVSTGLAYTLPQYSHLASRLLMAGVINQD